MISTLFWVLLVAWIARLVVHAWRPGPALQPHYEAEVARLRQEVDQLNAQVMRLSDEQQFMMRLLSEGEPSAEAGLPPPPQPENP